MRCLDYILFVALFISICSHSTRNTVSAARHRRHHAQHNQQSQQEAQETRASDNVEQSTSTWFAEPEFNIVRRVYEDCQDTNDFIGCLKQKALVALTRALDKDSIKIVDGLVLERQNQTEKESIVNAITDARTLSSLAPLDRVLLGKLDKLMRTHTLKVDMSTGRKDEKKKKKKGKEGHIKYIIAALVTAMGIAGPIGLKALAAIAVKALVISKVALTIAGIIALKKLFSHDHHEETSFQVHAGDHNRRSTYVIRPVPKASAMPTLSATSATMDPYRYYYEYHQ